MQSFQFGQNSERVPGTHTLLACIHIHMYVGISSNLRYQIFWRNDLHKSSIMLRRFHNESNIASKYRYLFCQRSTSHFQIIIACPLNLSEKMNSIYVMACVLCVNCFAFVSLSKLWDKRLSCRGLERPWHSCDLTVIRLTQAFQQN